MQINKIRDKERTKTKLIKAVGKILKKEGYKNIRINNVARVSGVNKKLIYDNFGGIDGLINAYLKSTDIWLKEEGNIGSAISTLPVTKELLTAIHQDAFNKLEASEEMQKIILWGISEKNKSVRKITDQREKWGNALLKKAKEKFKGSDVDLSAVNAIILSGIYYMVLHSKTNGSTICGMDISKTKDKQRIFDTIKKITDFSCEKKK